LVAASDAIGDGREVVWRAGGDYVPKMKDMSATLIGANSFRPEKPSEASARLEAMQVAVAREISDKFRDPLWQCIQRFLAAGEKIEKAIARGEADCETFESLRSDDRRQLVDLLRAQELKSDIFSRPVGATLAILKRALKSGDSDTIRKIVVPAEARALQILRMSLDELAKEVAPAVASDDSLKAVREAAGRLHAFCMTYRQRQRPEWIDQAKAAWAMLDVPRRAVWGPSVDFMVSAQLGQPSSGDTSLDKGFSTSRWLDWRTVQDDAIARVLKWPNLKIPGWTNVVMQDHTPGAAPGAVVRANPLPTTGPYRFGAAQPGGR
jgi:hypothetical protein